MLNSGPIPRLFHGLIEYIAAVVLIGAPFVLDFHSDAATAVSIVAGIVVLIVTASSDLPSGLSKTIPIPVHILLDGILAVVLIASPFLFGYHDRSTPTAFFIIVGVFHLLVTIGTRFREPSPEVAAKRPAHKQQQKDERKARKQAERAVHKQAKAQERAHGHEHDHAGHTHGDEEEPAALEPTPNATLPPASVEPLIHDSTLEPLPTQTDALGQVHPRDPLLGPLDE